MGFFSLPLWPIIFSILVQTWSEGVPFISFPLKQILKTFQTFFFLLRQVVFKLFSIVSNCMCFARRSRLPYRYSPRPLHWLPRSATNAAMRASLVVDMLSVYDYCMWLWYEKVVHGLASITAPISMLHNQWKLAAGVHACLRFAELFKWCMLTFRDWMKYASGYFEYLYSRPLVWIWY